MKWYWGVLEKYCVFAGRARRLEYWMFFLFNFMIVNVIMTICGILTEFFETAVIVFVLAILLYSLATFLPGLAVGVRRIHDTGRSGWFIFVPIYSLILLVKEGDRQDNRYGPNPEVDED